MVDAIRPAITPLAPGLAAPISATPEPGSASRADFASAIGDAVGALNSQLTGADAAMTSFAAGESSADLHQVLLQMQEASIAISTATAVRDRLLDAYGEVMRLNV
jgi:flagellar hook-basal body complex protein FliE